MWQNIGLVALVVTGAPIVWRTVCDAVRGRFAADIVAVLQQVIDFAVIMNALRTSR